MTDPAPTTFQLLVCGDQDALARVITLVSDLSVHTRAAANVNDALVDIGNHPPDAVIVASSNEDDVTRIGLSATLPVIVVAELADVKIAVRMMRAGAHSYVTYDASLTNTVREIASINKPESVRPRWTQNEREIFNRIINRSRAMNLVIARIRALAHTPNTTGLILGESGTGKELIAGAIHSLSARAEKPFIPVDCGAIPENLIETELFGHEQGAFSGATARKRGRFELAHGGTLFFDEIGELPLPMQSKLLRALEERQIWRVGGTAPIPVDVRVVAATNRSLQAMVEAHSFRADLYFRLSVFVIDVPPLRERGADVLHLADHFLERFNAELGRQITGLSPAAKAKLVGYSFPGNVRELKNTLEEAVISATSRMLDARDIKTPHSQDTPIAAINADGSIPFAFGPNALDQLERHAIELAMNAAAGNQTKAAGLLGINRLALGRALARHGIAVVKPKL